jgi:hypothetical protein
MTQAPTIIERAFELARAGSCVNVSDIRTQLKRERYDAVEMHIQGSLAKQLLALCRGARAQRNGTGDSPAQLAPADPIDAANDDEEH